MTRALVLGGGGITGIAWEFGILGGLARAGLTVGDADIIVGTSAGSVVGTVVAAGLPLEDAVAAQTAPPGPGAPASAVDLTPAMAAFALMADRSQPRAEIMAQIGQLALAAPTVDEQTHVARMAVQLPVSDWPAGDLRITAVDTANGEPAVFDRASGAPIELAVAASCAVPGLFPPVTIDGRRYMDGGVRSGTNADLAEGATALLIVAPLSGPLRPLIEREIATVGAARSLVIEPDEAALEAIGPNALDPSRRALAAEAGLRQGAALAQSVRELWNA
ncbi:patatin-like phospholipase family protein [Dactylosporangium sp. NPDC051541]|uniref:patatin-like phospholipase family protein n=1 Tax=Dactylosporangium sp. NPDC051541 TaxID=3363977 RepID=UPI0037B1BDBC